MPGELGRALVEMKRYYSDIDIVSGETKKATEFNTFLQSSPYGKEINERWQRILLMMAQSASPGG